MKSRVGGRYVVPAARELGDDAGARAALEVAEETASPSRTRFVCMQETIYEPPSGSRDIRISEHACRRDRAEVRLNDEARIVGSRRRSAALPVEPYTEQAIRRVAGAARLVGSHDRLQQPDLRRASFARTDRQTIAQRRADPGLLPATRVSPSMLRRLWRESEIYRETLPA